MRAISSSRQFDLTPAEIESWVEDGKRGMEIAWLAPFKERQGQYSVGRTGAGIDHALWHAGLEYEPFLLRSDNGLLFTSRDYTRLVRSHGLKREFITPHLPSAKRAGRACDLHTEGAVSAPASFRKPDPCPAGDR